jgi:hypothetical protein
MACGPLRLPRTPDTQKALAAAARAFCVPPPRRDGSQGHYRTGWPPARPVAVGSRIADSAVRHRKSS